MGKLKYPIYILDNCCMIKIDSQPLKAMNYEEG